MSKYTETQVEQFANIAHCSIEVRKLSKLLSRDVTEFNSLQDFYNHLDSTMEPIKFLGSVLKPSEMAAITAEQDSSTLDAEHAEWIQGIDKRELIEFKELKERYEERRQALSEFMDAVEAEVTFDEPEATAKAATEETSEEEKPTRGRRSKAA